MYLNKIEISASRSDDDQYWRIHRIYLIIGYAQSIADSNGNEDFYKNIKSIYDDKGRLTIIWFEQPTNEEKNYLKKAWESIVTDNESNPIEHTVK